MKGTKPVDQVGSVDANGLAVGEVSLNDFKGLLIIGVSKDRDQDHSVADVEIGIAGREPACVLSHGSSILLFVVIQEIQNLDLIPSWSRTIGAIRLLFNSVVNNSRGGELHNVQSVSVLILYVL